MGWYKTIDNENFEFWECDTCTNPEHNYIIIKKGVVEDRREYRKWLIPNSYSLK